MADTASFAKYPWHKIVQIAAANPNRDGTGTIVGAAMPATGGRCDRIEIKAVGNTADGMVRAYKRPAAGAWSLWREFRVSAIVPNSTTESFWRIVDDIGEVLEGGFEVGFSTHNAEAFVIHVSGGSF